MSLRKASSGDGNLVFNDVLPRGPSQLTWPFIGNEPHLPIFGGFPFLHASNNAMVVSGVKHS